MAARDDLSTGARLPRAAPTTERAQLERRAAEIFRSALALPPGARAACVRERCAGDEALLAEVEGLLRADEAAGDFLESSPFAAAALDDAGRLVGARLGRHTISRLIGVGGMGAVYEAVQDEPRRTVAIKVIRHGLASRALLRRFENESRILGRLHHPGIAQIFEAGVHEDGERQVPYFVMEHVEGARPIVQHACERRLEVRQRLELFAQACDALHHGHRMGVVHRDLKPGNLLVDAAGAIKVIDFGVARMTDSDVAATTLGTDVGELVGTLQYMSPEQVGGDPRGIDLRSDVYSLGVVLYELLCGRVPYDLGEVHMLEAARRIREQAPVRPSTANRVLRGDLETVLLKALEKDRTRRYQSAAELAADVRRVIARQPIAARRPSLAYQFRMFSRRNKALVGSVAAAFALLAGALAVVSALAVGVQRESARRQEINGFLMELLMLAQPNPFAGDAPKAHGFTASTPWIEIVDEWMRRLDESPLGDREAEAAIRHGMGLVYLWMNRHDQAHACLEWAAEARRELLGEDSVQAIESKAALAWSKIFLYQGEEAERLAAEAVADYDRVCPNPEGEDARCLLDALVWLGVSRMYLGYNDDMAESASRMLDIIEAHPELDYPTYGPKAMLATFLVRFPDRLDEAERLAREAVEESEVRGAFTSVHGFAHITLARIHRARQESASEEACLRRGIDAWARRNGEAATVVFWPELAACLCADPARREEGITMLHSTIATARTAYGPHHPITASTLFECALVFARADRARDAERCYRDAIEAWRLGRHTPTKAHAFVLHRFGCLLREQNRLEEAVDVHRRAVSVASAFPAQAWRRHSWGSAAPLWAELGVSLDEWGRHGEAAKCHARARQEVCAAMRAPMAHFVLSMHERCDRLSEGEDVARALVKFIERDPSTSSEDRIGTLLQLGRVLEARGQLADAEALLREANARAMDTLGVEHPATLWAMACLSRALQGRGATGEAESRKRPRIDVTPQALTWLASELTVRA